MRLLPQAWIDLLEISAWYESRRPSLRKEFLLAFLAEAADLRQLPMLHEVAALNTRRFRFRRFPYMVFYQVEHGEIVVSGLVHERRDRRTWGDLIREYHPIHADIAA